MTASTTASTTGVAGTPGMTGVLSVTLSAERRYDGPMGKSDRAFVFGALALALGFGFDKTAWMNGLLILVAVLSTVTVVNRSRKALAELQSQ